MGMNQPPHDAARESALLEGCERALEQARRGPLGANPRVGAALLSPSGELLVTGFHRGARTPHAEADALATARENGLDVHGATCIVTLEPCAHAGRTPSCARALVDAGIGRVLYAVRDPHDIAANGSAILRSAGIDTRLWSDALPATVGGDLTARAAELNRRWFQATRESRPFVTAKIAHTLDGYVAAADGTNAWITGEDARAEGHALRSTVDAIAVGTGTALTDDPALTARDAHGTLAQRQPRRVVIGERPLEPHSRLAKATQGPEHARPLLYRTREIRAVFENLRAEHGVEHLLLEGGPRLISAALTLDLVDDLWIHEAPTLLGAGTPAVTGLGIGTLKNRLDFDIVPESLHVSGSDLLFHAIPRARQQTPTKGE